MTSRARLKQLRETSRDPLTAANEKRNSELSRIHVSRKLWFGKLLRAARAIEKLNREEQRLMRPRKLSEGEAINSEQYTKIRTMHDFNDAMSDLT